MKAVRIISNIVLGMLLVAFSAFLLLVIIPAYKSAEMTGGVIGKTVGGLVGAYIGITEKAQEGAADGKAQGLSAEDTVVSMTNEIETLGNGYLEVLEASISIDNKVSIGKNVDYAVLYGMKGTIIFKIDLNKVSIDQKTNTIYIPYPEDELIIDESIQPEMIDQYSKDESILGTLIGNDATDAVTAINNEKENLKANSKLLDNYEYLYEQACESAKTEIEILAYNASNGKTYNVEFK